MISAVASVSLSWSGDVTLGQTFYDPTNPSSPGQEQVLALSSGNNTVSVPTGAQSVTLVKTVNGVTNTATLTFKGVNGDTGYALSPTVTDKISVSGSSFVINASASTSIRAFWS